MVKKRDAEPEPAPAEPSPQPDAAPIEEHEPTYERWSKYWAKLHYIEYLPFALFYHHFHQMDEHDRNEKEKDQQPALDGKNERELNDEDRKETERRLRFD